MRLRLKSISCLLESKVHDQPFGEELLLYKGDSRNE